MVLLVKVSVELKEEPPPPGFTSFFWLTLELTLDILCNLEL